MATEDTALPEKLPLSLRGLRDTTIELARRIDGVIAALEDSAGYAEIRIEVSRGVPRMLRIERSFKLEG